MLFALYHCSYRTNNMKIRTSCAQIKFVRTVRTNANPEQYDLAAVDFGLKGCLKNSVRLKFVWFGTGNQKSLGVIICGETWRDANGREITWS